jgi:hypothetical protein
MSRYSLNELASHFIHDFEPTSEQCKVRYALMACFPHDFAPMGAVKDILLFGAAAETYQHGYELVFAGMLDGEPMFVPNGSGKIATFEDRSVVNALSNTLNHAGAYVNLALVDNTDPNTAQYIPYAQINQAKSAMEVAHA